MLSQHIQDIINEQIKSEMYSAHLYLSMSAYCETINLSGFAKLLREHNEEEMSHAMRLFDYILDRNSKVELGAIDKPPSDFPSLLAVFEKVYEHEKAVTEMINNIYALSVKEKDYPTQVEMQWFISEQVEEEKTALHVLERIRMVGDSGPALLFLDTHIINEDEEVEEIR
ncbi:MAG: ferritin [Thermodesulfobacteriota bacterium]